MTAHILWMNGIDCGKCFRPADHHNFLTGLTFHVSPHATPCRIHPPRPIPTPVGGD